MKVLELMEKLNTFRDDDEIELVIVAEDKDGNKHYITSTDVKIKFQLKGLVSIYGDADKEYVA